MGNELGLVCCAQSPVRRCESITRCEKLPLQMCVEGWRIVHLAVSEFPSSNNWAFVTSTAYHTSLLVSGQEYFFDPSGVQQRKFPYRGEYELVPASHTDKKQTAIYPVGQTMRTGKELVEKLREHFEPGSYDLIAKNCNAFTDCALAFFLSRRLPKKFYAAESFGKDINAGVLSLASGGRYKSNPMAQCFDIEATVMRIDENAWMGSGELGEFENGSGPVLIHNGR